ncbi:hypothetical protein [Leifsonia shinshuensis]|uniref:Uncharacterized protein n=1 Tax=Leifsonia shinshuensis TaxID=150026 RepID=A0A853CQP4_9MICO|nr:hypothetical protein [Leifsonia shinshuensis]NYJ22608.1 hypothetical protein [Leifsonia shinshuensis]
MTGMTVAPIVTRSRTVRLRDAVARRPVVLLIALGLGCAVLAWLRIPAIARDTFWAEDGRTFISSAALGGPAVLLQPYAGYLHTVPRLVAAAVVLLPVSWWALATTAAACAIAGGLAVVVFVCARDLVPWLPARLFVAGLTVLAPFVPREVLGDLADLHSLVLWALFWIALSRPRTLRAGVVLAVVAFLGALTEIQALFLAPLLLLRGPGLPSWRDRRVLLVRASLIAGLAVQLVVTLGWPRAENTNPAVDPLSMAYGYLINAVMPLAVPQAQLGHVLAATGPAVGLGVLAVVVATALYVVVRGSRAQRLLVIAALAGSVLLYTVSVAANPNTFYDYARLTPAQLQTAWLTRYGVVPSMLLALVPAVAATVALARRREAAVRRALGGPAPRPWRVWSVLAAAGLSAALILAQAGPQFTRRSDGPAWQPQLASAAAQCRRDDELRFVNLKETIGWSVSVPCRSLDGGTTEDSR